MAKNNSELQGIRKKLVAAIAMVLVATIMVVSSSYAWFTLSTAPEVKGIQTSVGSNGNLEMALRTESSLASIETKVGQSGHAANITWGNLVDLSLSQYNLSGIALRPAGLNVVEVPGTGVKTYKTDTDGNYLAQDGTKLYEKLGYASNAEVTTADLETDGQVDRYIPKEYQFSTVDTIYLKTPVYGTDGRVSEIDDNTTHGTYVPGKGFVENKGAYGVRAIGTVSGLTSEQIILRDARLAVTGTAGNVTTAAQTSLQVDAVKIANIAVKKQLEGDSVTYEAELADVKTAIDNLQAVTAQLETALKKAVVAVGASQKITFTDADVTLSADDIALSGAAASLDWNKAPANARQSIIDAYNVIVRMNGDLTDAETEAAKYNATDKKPTYDNMVTIVTKVLNPNDIKIDGMTVDELMGGNLADAAMILTGNPTVSIEEGIYADIAKFVGNYSVGTSIHAEGDFGTFGKLNDDFPVTMITAATEPAGGWYLTTYIIGWMNNLTVDTTGGSSTDVVISDLYAYMLDLAFRTNATGSNLLLQSAPANRVDNSAATQGAGSYMEFTSGHIDFTIVQMGQLMENIRVVFIGDDGKIMAIAALEVFTNLVDGSGAKVAYVEGTEGHLFEDKDGYAMTWANPAGVNETTKTVKAMLYLYDFTVNAVDGTVSLTGKSTSQDITALQQNVATGISTLVYLDGNEVENKDVAISGDSMSGTMNLQFASSATLTPMAYTYAEPLAVPETSLTGDTLTVNKVDNATTYKVYMNETLVATLDANAGPVDLKDAAATVSLPGGDYTIKVTAEASGFTASTATLQGQYTLTP